MDETYHIRLNYDKIQQAGCALITGDPDRVPEIASQISQNFLELERSREFRSVLAFHEADPILILSHGIGGPSTAIVMEEMAMIGIRTVIRIGTTGAIQDNIAVGDVIISSASVRLDGTTIQYVPIEYPAVATPEIVMLLKAAAIDLCIPYHVGITASTDSFYPGQERYDSFLGYVQKKLQGSREEWKKFNVLNYEMESSTVLTLGNLFKMKTGCITGVVDNRIQGESILEANKKKAVDNAIKVGVLALKNHLIQPGI